MLRTLGLRHICVVPTARRVVGVITRKDIQGERLAEQLKAEDKLRDALGAIGGDLGGLGTIWEKEGGEA